MKPKLPLILLGLFLMFLSCLSGCGLPSDLFGSYADYYYPDWTPDGKIICVKAVSRWEETGGFRSISSTKYYIVTMSEEGTQETTIKQTDRLGKVAASPLGNYIAYTDGNYIRVINLNGVSLNNIDTGAAIESFDWAPDESRIVYGSNVDILTDNRIVVINRDGSNSQTIASGRTPSWTSTNEANKIIFNSETNYKIWIYNLNSSATIEINASGFQFDWLPNGSEIIFVDNGIWIINADGNGKNKILNTILYFPKASSTGLKFVLGNMNDSGIWTFNKDGTGLKQIK